MLSWNDKRKEKEIEKLILKGKEAEWQLLLLLCNNIKCYYTLQQDNTVIWAKRYPESWLLL